MLAFPLLLLLSLLTGGMHADESVGWDRRAIVVKEGAKVEVTCGLKGVGLFDILVITYRGQENGAKRARKFSENNQLMVVYAGREDYMVHFDSSKPLVQTTAVFENIKYVDSGVLACYCMGKEKEGVHLLNITVSVPVEESNLVVVAPGGLKGAMGADDDDEEDDDGEEEEGDDGEGKDDEDEGGDVKKGTKSRGFSERFFQSIVNARGSGSEISFPFNSPNHLVCYANSKSPFFSVKVTLDGNDLDFAKHHVTRLQTPEDEEDDDGGVDGDGKVEKFSLDVVGDDLFWWKAVVVDKVDHDFHEKEVACVAQVAERDDVIDAHRVSVQFAPVIECNQKMEGGPHQKFKITCHVSANPLADVNVTKGGDVIASTIVDDDDDEDEDEEGYDDDDDADDKNVNVDFQNRNPYEGYVNDEGAPDDDGGDEDGNDDGEYNDDDDDDDDDGNEHNGGHDNDGGNKVNDEEDDEDEDEEDDDDDVYNNNNNHNQGHQDFTNQNNHNHNYNNMINHNNNNNNNNNDDDGHNINQNTNNNNKTNKEADREKDLEVKINRINQFTMVVMIEMTSEQVKHYNMQEPISIVAENRFGRLVRKVSVTMENHSKSQTGSSVASNSRFSGTPGQPTINPTLLITIPIIILSLL